MNPQSANSNIGYYSYLLNSLTVKAKTWQRDSHGLFDYENHDVKSTTIEIKKSGVIYRTKDNVKFSSVLDTEKEEGRELATFTLADGKPHLKIDDKFLLSSKLESNLPVNNETLTDLQDKLWHVVKTNSSNSSVANTNSGYMSGFQYELRRNDIMKLGRIKFVIKDLNLVNGNFITTQQTFRPYLEYE